MSDTQSDKNISFTQMIRVTHNAGFFSCCTIRLLEIINYFNTHLTLPTTVDSSQQFELYKSNHRQDLTYKFFVDNADPKHIIYRKPVNALLSGKPDNVHYPNYNNVDYAALAPFVNKYFSPAPAIKEKIAELENKYKLDYDKTCLVYYRGNDKVLEVNCPDYGEIFLKAWQVKKDHPEVRFVVQSDEAEFIAYFLKRFPNSVVLDEVAPIRKQVINPGMTLPPKLREKFACDFLAIIYFLAKIKYIVTTTHNAAFWLCLFRGHSNGVYQYLKAPVSTEQKPSNNYWFA